MFQYDPYGILALVALAMCLALAVVLYRVGMTGSVARMLALLLVVEGVTLISTGFIDLFFTPVRKRRGGAGKRPAGTQCLRDLASGAIASAKCM